MSDSRKDAGFGFLYKTPRQRGSGRHPGSSLHQRNVQEEASPGEHISEQAYRSTLRGQEEGKYLDGGDTKQWGPEEVLESISSTREEMEYVRSVLGNAVWADQEFFFSEKGLGDLQAEIEKLKTSVIQQSDYIQQQSLRIESLQAEVTETRARLRQAEATVENSAAVFEEHGKHFRETQDTVERQRAIIDALSERPMDELATLILQQPDHPLSLRLLRVLDSAVHKRGA